MSEVRDKAALAQSSGNDDEPFNYGAKESCFAADGRCTLRGACIYHCCQ